MRIHILALALAALAVPASAGRPGPDTRILHLDYTQGLSLILDGGVQNGAKFKPMAFLEIRRVEDFAVLDYGKKYRRKDREGRTVYRARVNPRHTRARGRLKAKFEGDELVRLRLSVRWPSRLGPTKIRMDETDVTEVEIRREP